MSSFPIPQFSGSLCIYIFENLPEVKLPSKSQTSDSHFKKFLSFFHLEKNPILAVKYVRYVKKGIVISYF